MTVGRKLMICVSGMLTVILGLAGAWWFSNRGLSLDLALSSSVVGPRAILAGELRGDVAALRESMRGLLLYTLAKDQNRAEENRADFEKHFHAAKEGVVDVRELSTSVRGKELLQSIDADLDKYGKYFEEAYTLSTHGKVMDAVKLNRDGAAPVGTQMEHTADDYLYLQKEQLAEIVDSAIGETAGSRWTGVTFVGAGLAAVIVIAYVTRKITQKLRTITRNLSEGTAQISSGSRQVSQSSQLLAEGASEQAASLEETSASAEEITSMTRQNASNTSEVAQLMITVDQRVADGNTTLGSMLVSMSEITASSHKISKIIKVIDEIAFQTNILALNAAVEAARAGEAGAGFAVVADEVRSLAQRSAQAAKDTATLIEDSIQTSHEGSAQLQRVVDVVGSITEAAAKVKVLVDEVNIGSQEQAKGIEEIARSLTEMDRVTQGTAAAAEQSASASAEMSSHAQSLTCLVEELTVMAGTSE